MNKQEFLMELQSRIHILAETEQQDILAEYAQHIDLRTAAGLSEEEAIRDFGDLGQLASEILEAYHVDPAHLPPEQVRTSRLEGASAAMRRAGSRGAGFLRRLGHGIAAGFRRFGRGITSLFSRCGAALKQLFHRRPGPAISSTASVKEELPVKTTSKVRPVLSSTRQAAGRAFRAMGRFFVHLLRLAWNLLMVLCAIPFAAAGMLALISIGLLLVLLIQGYPLAGVLLCCLGIMLCCTAILVLCITLIRKPGPCPSAAGAPSPMAPSAVDDHTPARNVQPAESEIPAAIPQIEEVSHHA